MVEVTAHVHGRASSTSWPQSFLNWTRLVSLWPGMLTLSINRKPLRSFGRIAREMCSPERAKFTPH
jgi:hypothetical protein